MMRTWRGMGGYWWSGLQTASRGRMAGPEEANNEVGRWVGERVGMGEI